MRDRDYVTRCDLGDSIACTAGKDLTCKVTMALLLSLILSPRNSLHQINSSIFLRFSVLKIKHLSIYGLILDPGSIKVVKLGGVG